MKQTFERVEKHLFKRQYRTAGGDWSTIYYARFTDWKGKRRMFPLGSDLETAKEELTVREAQNIRREDFDKEKSQTLTFSAWGEMYFEKLISPEKRAVEWEKSMFSHLKSYFGNMLLSEIDEPKIDAYRNQRLADPIMRHGKPVAGRKLCFSSVNRELAVLRLLLRLAKRHKKIEVVPEFKLQSERGRKRDRVATDEEYAAILERMPRHAQRVLTGLYETSARVNELLNLTWDRIDEKAGLIRLRAEDVKEKSPRLTPISPELGAVLKELKAEQKKLASITNRVFTHDGKPIASIRKPFETAKRKAEIENLTLHDFRHTCITRWEMMGIPPGAIMAASGHHTFEMHNRYVNVKEHHLKDAFKMATQWQHEKAVDAANPVSY